jgi:hypothetical protein
MSGGMVNNPTYIAQRDSTLQMFADEADIRGIDLHLIVESGHTTSVTGSPNVRVLEGSGTASPFTITGPDGTFGSGATMIREDANQFIYAADGADIYLDAGLDDGLNSVWEDVLDRWDLTMDAGVSHIADAGSALPGITSAYEFPGGTASTGGCDGVSWTSLGADQVPATLELWFKPGAAASYPANGQVLWETGGGTGLGIFYRDGFVETAHDSNAQQLSADVSALTNEFIQVVVTYDTGSTTDNFKLYINGESKATASRNDGDICGSDTAGLGNRAGHSTGGAGGGDSSTESFEGLIARFRAYHDQILDADQVMSNYQAIAVSIAYSVIYDGNGNATGSVPVDENSYTAGRHCLGSGQYGRPDEDGFCVHQLEYHCHGNGIIL